MPTMHGSRGRRISVIGSRALRRAKEEVVGAALLAAVKLFWEQASSPKQTLASLINSR